MWRAYMVVVKNPRIFEKYKLTLPESKLREHWELLEKHKDDPRLVNFLQELSLEVRTGAPMNFTTQTDLNHVFGRAAYPSEENSSGRYNIPFKCPGAVKCISVRPMDSNTRTGTLFRVL
jgi:hypothetical protein